APHRGPRPARLGAAQRPRSWRRRLLQRGPAGLRRARVPVLMMMSKLGRVGFLLGVVLLVLVGGKLGQAHLLAAFTGSALPVACASLYHLVPLTLYAESWRALLPREPRRPFWQLLRLRWMGESINALLPVAQVGGDLVRARRLVRVGVPAPDASASMIGDFTTGFASQLVFTLV